MKTKILKVQKSNRPIWETRLSVNGTISDATPSDEQAYEMRIDLYHDESSMLPEKTIIIHEEYYENNIMKHGMEALLRGVRINSMLSIMEEAENAIDLYKREVDSISYSIVARMEQGMLSHDFNPENMKNYIESRLLKLRDKFNINPK